MDQIKSEYPHAYGEIFCKKILHFNFEKDKKNLSLLLYNFFFELNIAFPNPGNGYSFSTIGSGELKNLSSQI